MDTPSPALLETDHLSIHFEDRPALEEVSVRFYPGEIVSLAGPNGAGKSSLLRALAGILPASHGSLRFNGEEIEGPNPRVIYVPQRSSVDWSFPISVIEVALMARMQQRTRLSPFSKRDREMALASLEQVGMEQLRGVQISQLSGGQQQRVFLARALLAEGEVYLLDEPYTGVDAPTKELVSQLFQQLCASGKTIIAASHDLEHAAESSSRIVLLNRKVIADGPPEAVLTANALDAAYGSQFRVLGQVMERGFA